MTVSEVRAQEITIPAGTAQLSPQVSDISFPSRVVAWVEIVFPPGPRGQVGVALTMNGNAVIPLIAGTWLVMDNYTEHLDVQGYPDSGAWELTAYNTGQYDHTIYLRWGLNYLGSPAPPMLTPIAASQLTGVVPSL